MSVEIDGQPRERALRGRQVPLLLAYLLLHRTRHVSRDELIGALWHDDAPVSQDGALRTLLSRLRSALGSDALSGRDELVLRLPEPVWIDLEAASVEVQRAQQALAGGEPRSAWGLAQVPLNIAGRGLLPGVQASWLDTPRRELEETRLEALEVIGKAGLAIGGAQLASAERAGRAMIAAEPYRESGYVLLMQALAAGGNAAAALRVFDRLRTLLREELGIAPSRETLAVFEHLLRPEEPSRGPAAHGERVPAAPIEFPRELAARAAAALVGRVSELARLRELWLRAREDAGEEGRLVLLCGEPGIGKTRLLAELARSVHEEGAIVLHGRSPEETLVPYQPFLEALRHYVRAIPLPELRATAREYGGELARLVPELRRRVPGLAPPPSEPDSERYRLFESVVGLMEEIAARTPLLLVLDDLHWADRPSLLLLRHLARVAQPPGLLILGAYRASESTVGGFGETLAELRRDRVVTQLEIGGLTERETSELVRVRTGSVPSGSLSRALQDETAGNPLFVEERVRSLAETGVDVGTAGAHDLRQAGLPETVRDVISRRLGQLDPKTIDWLRAAAVIGRDFDLDLLERVVPADDERFLEALEEALGADLVAESPERPGRYSFSHTLVREILYATMSAPRRRRIHRRVGQTLEERGAEHDLPALALHFARAAGAEDADKAIAYARRAAEQATAMLAHEEAADHYSRALEVNERFRPEELALRCELMLLVGEARVRAGERPLAWPAFRRAAQLAAALGDKDSLARAAIGASRRYVQPPGVLDEDMILMLDQALALTAEDRNLARVQLLARMCGALYYSPRREEIPALADEATELADALGAAEGRAIAAAARRRARWGPSDLDRRLSDATEVLTLGRQAGNLELALQGHAWLVVDLLERGRAAAVEAQIDAFSAEAERLRQPLFLWNAAIWRAMWALLCGRLDQAEELAQEALTIGSSGERVTAPLYNTLQLLAIRQEQERIEELEERARAAVQTGAQRPAWRASLATLLSASGRVSEARREVEALAAGGFAQIPRDGEWLGALALLADLCADLRLTAPAARLYELLLPYRESTVVVELAAVCLGSVARYLGRLATVLGRTEDAAGHLQRALECNATLAAPVLVAHTQLDYAELLGADDRSTELIDSAAQTAAGLGLARVARRAAHLRDAGAGDPGAAS